MNKNEVPPKPKKGGDPNPPKYPHAALTHL